MKEEVTAQIIIREVLLASQPHEYQLQDQLLRNQFAANVLLLIYMFQSTLTL